MNREELENELKRFSAFARKEYNLGLVPIIMRYLSTLPDEKEECEHDWMYKILHNHRAADVCTKCGKIKLQSNQP